MKQTYSSYVKGHAKPKETKLKKEPTSRCSLRVIINMILIFIAVLIFSLSYLKFQSFLFTNVVAPSLNVHVDFPDEIQEYHSVNLQAEYDQLNPLLVMPSTDLYSEETNSTLLSILNIESKPSKHNIISIEEYKESDGNENYDDEDEYQQLKPNVYIDKKILFSSINDLKTSIIQEQLFSKLFDSKCMITNHMIEEFNKYISISTTSSSKQLQSESILLGDSLSFYRTVSMDYDYNKEYQDFFLNLLLNAENLKKNEKTKLKILKELYTKKYIEFTNYIQGIQNTEMKIKQLSDQIQLNLAENKTVDKLRLKRNENILNYNEYKSKLSDFLYDHSSQIASLYDQISKQQFTYKYIRNYYKYCKQLQSNITTKNAKDFFIRYQYYRRYNNEHKLEYQNFYLRASRIFSINKKTSSDLLFYPINYNNKYNTYSLWNNEHMNVKLSTDLKRSIISLLNINPKNYLSYIDMASIPIKLDKEYTNINLYRAQFIRNETRFLWNTYMGKCPGYDVISVDTIECINTFGGISATFFSLFDTLYITGGNVREQAIRDYIENYFHYTSLPSSPVVIDYINNDILPSLLFMYQVYEKDFYLHLAEQIVNQYINLNDKNSLYSIRPLSFLNVTLPKTYINEVYMGNTIKHTMQYRHLSELSHNNTYAQFSNSILTTTLALPTFKNMIYSSFKLPAYSVSGDISVGKYTINYYESLLKTYIQSGRIEKSLKHHFDDAIEAMSTYLSDSKNVYSLYHIVNSGKYYSSFTMDITICKLPGLLALSSINSMGKTKAKHILMAKKLIYTCYLFHTSSETFLPFQDINIKVNSKGEMGYTTENSKYKLESDYFESLYILHQVTNNPTYIEWGWIAYRSLYKYCRSKYGYSNYYDLTSIYSTHENIPELSFYSGGLKYLYLLFNPYTLFNINSFTFTSNGHILPNIKYINTFLHIPSEYI